MDSYVYLNHSNHSGKHLINYSIQTIAAMPVVQGTFNTSQQPAAHPPVINYHNLNTTIMRSFNYSLRPTVQNRKQGLFVLLSAITLLLSFFFSIQVSAQTAITPSNCVQGCTSNDVQIIKAYLSDANGNRLGNSFVCPGDGSAVVNLTLELTTNTPRKGVAIYAKVKQLLPASPPEHPTAYPGNEVSGSPISKCFSVVLNQPTNKVIFLSAFTWTCGTPIALTDVFIAWGTGNESKNFCTSGNFQCPATPSKCFSLPGDQFIAIETPSANTASDSKCATQPGGTTAIFDLTSLESTVKNGQSNVNVAWYTDAALANQISADPTQTQSTKAYTTATTTVYAKVCSTVSPFPCSAGQAVNLTVNPKPNLSITDPGAVCSPSKVDLTAGSVTNGSTLATNLSYWTDAQATTSLSTPGSVGTGTYYIKATAGTCSDIKAVNAIVNPSPSLSIHNPDAVCSPSKVDLTAAAVTDGSTLPTGTVLTYWTNVEGTSAVSTPGEVGAGTYYIKATAGSCSDIKPVVVTVNPTPSLKITNPTAVCSPSKVDLTAAAVTDGSTLPTGTVLTYWTNVEGTSAVSTPGEVGAGTYYIKATAGSCSDIKPVVVTVNQKPELPAFTVIQPSLCGPETGTLTICQSISGFNYTVGTTTKPGNGGTLAFTSLAAGTNPKLTVVNTTGSCSSAEYSCSDAVSNCPTVAGRIAAKSTNLVTDAAPLQVKAYPNPFHDRINFVVTSPVSGKGSLDVYNSLGQKIRTVYQGNINKGNQNFELRLSQRQVSNLIYVLNVNGQKVSGKILQVNQ